MFELYRNKLKTLSLICTGLILCFISSGCATIKSIEKNYKKIDYSDGINKSEAKLIAKKSLIDSPYRNFYRVIRPRILDNDETLQHPRYWFLKFRRKSSKLNKSNYFVVIEKKTGEVIYAEKHYPNNAQNYRWILELHEYQGK